MRAMATQATTPIATKTSSRPSMALPNEVSLRENGEQDDEEQVREGIDHVGEAHQEVIDAPAEPAGRGADRNPDEQDHHLYHQGDGHVDCAYRRAAG